MRKSLPKKVSPLERDTQPVLTNIPQPRRTRLNRYQQYKAAEEANRELREELKDREKVRRVPYKLTRTERLPPPPPHLYNLRERFERVDRANPEQPRLPIFPEAVPNSVPTRVMGDTQIPDFPVINSEQSTSLLGEEEPELIITKQPGESKKGGKRKYKTTRKMKSKKYKRKYKSKNTRKYKKSIKKIS